ncbi:hypothetical protein LPJ63_001012, partial [Coemansia sp. RSA 2711]
MVGRIFAGKSKAHPPKHATPQPQPDSGSSLETNYINYTHGSNVNAHMRPLTYDTLATNSLVAQPGSGLSSALSHSPPHHQQTQMLHGYGAPTAKNARRWSTQLPATAATGGASYQAFDQSAAHQPLTHSVLALPTAAPQKPANNGLRAAAAALPPTASAYVTSSANNPSQASHMHDAHGLRSQLPKSETATPPSVLESDMAAAGFSGMYSKYAPKKSALKAQSQSPP